MDATGNNPVRLTQNDASDHNPKYSPDGRRIAFASQPFTEPGGPPEVWVVSADGTPPRQLTHNGGSYPSWSPDGAQIVYVRADWRTNAPENGVLWIINVDTEEERQLLSKWPNRCQTPVSNVAWGDFKERLR